MSDLVLGIDLGTTNSVVAVADGGSVRILADSDGRELLPSVVSFHPTGDVLVGYAARDRRMLDARNTFYSVKRLLGRPFASDEVRRARERFAFELAASDNGGTVVKTRGETYALSEISAFVLRELRRIAESATGKRCSKAVITVPANFSDLQRNATMAAGRVAGLEVLRVLNEPTAAALAYGYGKQGRERVAVFDMGGGTFDVSILELSGEVFEVIATAGDSYLGGDDIDGAVADLMADAFLREHRLDPRADPESFERLRAAAEWAKCELTDQDEVELRVEELAVGPAGQGLDLRYTLTRRKLHDLAGPIVARAFDACETTMRAAGIRPSQLDNVILVGGSTRMPLVRSMVAEYFQCDPRVEIDPDVVVAHGAALQAASLASGRRSQLAKVALRKVHMERVSTKGLMAAPGAVVPGLVSAPAGEGYRPAPPSAFRTVQAPSVPPPPLASAARQLAERARAPEPSDELDLLELEEFAEVAPPARASAAPAPGAPPPPAVRVQPVVPVAGSGPAYERVPEQPMPDIELSGPPPLLLDVTPLSLGVETVGGFCHTVIARNTAMPAENTQTFSTGRDGQTFISVRICQGEERSLEANQVLGVVELDGLRDAARGEVRIDVTFVIDADGALSVQARDLETGREQAVRIRRVGEIDDSELDALRERMEARFRPGGEISVEAPRA
ncbi:MAG: Hsp70 family protein [Myxococcales bacterium]|nr:Hsp70 family protein [Myxococcales bacterium]MCB9627655.1 Hsp70 family protein [Sandaracinaceae bacterium]